jgi:hypothetical protein
MSRNILNFVIRETRETVHLYFAPVRAIIDEFRRAVSRVA